VASAAAARFGPFEVLSRIGFGGMGEVFRARWAGAPGGAEIALKLIRPEHASDPRFRHMFLAEARVGAQLHHANIVATVDHGDVDGVLYLASELVDGISLHRLLSAPPPPSIAVGAYVLGAVLDALGHAHELRDAAGKSLGLVHRDVSPANVLLSRTGEVKLADFGVSKGAGAPMTLSGELKGKPAFMAPEQLPGRGPLDRRADLFAVGVMLHVIAVGRPPFTDVGSWLAGGARLDVGGPLADLITLSMAPDAAHRFASADEFALALRRAVAAVDPAAASAELAHRVRELAAVERPLTDMERLIMSELEPSGLIYAPDPSTGRLWMVGPATRTPTPAMAFDDSAPTHTRSYGVTPTREFGLRLIADSEPPLIEQTPTPLVEPTPTPTPLSMPSLPDELSGVPLALEPLGSGPLPAEPPQRRRWMPMVAVLALLLVTSAIAVVAASSREREPRAAPVATTTAPPKTPPPPPKMIPPPVPPPVELPPVEPPPVEPAPVEPAPAEARTAPPPSRAKPRPRPPEPATAYLTLDTDPWAVVYLGTRQLGPTPFLRVPVPPGHLNLIFDVQGSGRRVRRTVDIPAGASKRVALQLR
jgi:serine/threonine-protein kinase